MTADDIRAKFMNDVDPTTGPGQQLVAAETSTKGTVERMLRQAGLRPTRQRVALADIMFSKGNRHVTAEELYDEAGAAHVPVSLATVYNTLHQFTQSGLLREVAVDGTKTFFDTNVSDHHHFFIEELDTVIDVPQGMLKLGALPTPPTGTEIVRVDVVVRVRLK
jgi:Fur family iron response transcriptional regulator